MLVDRGGGASGEQTFVEAAAMAADAVAAVLVPASLASGGGGGGGGAGGFEPSYRWCRCVGVIIANNRAGHEVFPMAPPKTEEEEDGGSGGGGATTGASPGRRAPFPVVMVSRESGQILKDTLLSTTNTVSRYGCGGGGDGGGGCCSVPGRDAPWEGYRGQQQWDAWGRLGGESRYGMGSSSSSSSSSAAHHLDAMLGGGGSNLLLADGGIVSLGASENCRAVVLDTLDNNNSVRGGTPSSSSSSSSSAELESTCVVECPSDDGTDTTATVSSVDEGVYFGSQPHPVCSEWVGFAGAGAGAEFMTGGEEAGGEEAGAVGAARMWKRGGRMLYGAQTLPVVFKRSR